MFNHVTTSQFENFMTFFSTGVLQIVKNTAKRDGLETATTSGLLVAIKRYCEEDFVMAARLSAQLDVFCPETEAEMLADFDAVDVERLDAKLNALSVEAKALWALLLSAGEEPNWAFDDNVPEAAIVELVELGLVKRDDMESCVFVEIPSELVDLLA